MFDTGAVRTAWSGVVGQGGRSSASVSRETTSSQCSAQECVGAEAQDQHHHDDQKRLADEGRAVAEREGGADPGAGRLQRAITAAAFQNTAPVATKKAIAARLVATLTILADTEACRKSIPSRRMNRKIRKLPVPGPKNPS
jgi:hypothetical protein